MFDRRENSAKKDLLGPVFLFCDSWIYPPLKLKYVFDQTLLGVLSLKISKLDGMAVITADALTLGEVNGVYADIGTWQITHLDVNLTKEAAKELGYQKHMFGSVTVCLPTADISQVGNVITLNKSLQESKGLKESKAE